jgi:hypothetical protein
MASSLIWGRIGVLEWLASGVHDQLMTRIFRATPPDAHTHAGVRFSLAVYGVIEDVLVRTFLCSHDLVFFFFLLWAESPTGKVQQQFLLCNAHPWVGRSMPGIEPVDFNLFPRVISVAARTPSRQFGRLLKAYYQS